MLPSGGTPDEATGTVTLPPLKTHAPGFAGASGSKLSGAMRTLTPSPAMETNDEDSLKLPPSPIGDVRFTKQMAAT
jgi:hypothetical protein